MIRGELLYLGSCFNECFCKIYWIVFSVICWHWYITIFIIVLYCTLLASAQTQAEKKKIEVKMSSDPELAKYLHALGATDKEDIVSEERARRQQARQSRVAADIEAMDTDEQKVRNWYLLWKIDFCMLMDCEINRIVI